MPQRRRVSYFRWWDVHAICVVILMLRLTLGRTLNRTSKRNGSNVFEKGKIFWGVSQQLAWNCIVCEPKWLASHSSDDSKRKNACKQNGGNLIVIPHLAFPYWSLPCVPVGDCEIRINRLFICLTHLHSAVLPTHTQRECNSEKKQFLCCLRSSLSIILKPFSFLSPRLWIRAKISVLKIVKW